MKRWNTCRKKIIILVLALTLTLTLALTQNKRQGIT
jgi:hypothetical protein